MPVFGCLITALIILIGIGIIIQVIIMLGIPILYLDTDIT